MKSAIECFDELSSRLGSRKPALFLDYDGTLTPIVQDPASAFLPERAKRLLVEAKSRFPVGIISGRDLDDLMGRVGIAGIAYAGSHGLEIAFIDGERKQMVDGLQKCLRELEGAEIELRRLSERFKGALVERKRFGVALHYRAVAADQTQHLLKLFDEIASRHPCLRRSEGKKVAELLVKGSNKGAAISEIMIHEGITEETHLPIFVGDDLTDEDGFKALKGRGVGVIVWECPRLTEADYCLSGQGEVFEFLEKLVGSVQG
ncbi:MAG: trehalose-phosphatase [Candidatus Methanosuratincola sp.]